jgi:hypothetical protein
MISTSPIASRKHPRCLPLFKEREGRGNENGKSTRRKQEAEAGPSVKKPVLIV